MNNPFQAFGNMQNFMNQFNQFKQNFGNQNPQQMVQQLLDSGKMSQQQFNQLSQMASQIMGNQRRQLITFWPKIYIATY